MAEEKKEKKLVGVQVVQVATETMPMIQLEDGTILSDREALALILNKVSSIEKQLVGTK